MREVTPPIFIPRRNLRRRLAEPGNWYLLSFSLILAVAAPAAAGADVRRVGGKMKGFVVSEYIERMEKLACELSEDDGFIPIELWWGYDGWREKPDGRFEKVRRWKPEPVQQDIDSQALQFGIQNDYSGCQCIDRDQYRLLSLYLALQTMQTNQNSLYPGLVQAPSYTPDLTWCCCDFHRLFL